MECRYDTGRETAFLESGVMRRQLWQFLGIHQWCQRSDQRLASAFVICLVPEAFFDFCSEAIFNVNDDRGEVSFRSASSPDGPRRSGPWVPSSPPASGPAETESRQRAERRLFRVRWRWERVPYHSGDSTTRRRRRHATRQKPIFVMAALDGREVQSKIVP